MGIRQEAFTAISQAIGQGLLDLPLFQAILNVRLIREPTAVRLRFDTALPAFATVEIFRMVHGVVALDMEKENLAAREVELFGNARRQHSIRLAGLEQERRHWYRISVPRQSPVQPQATGKVRARGEFATLRRNVSIDLGQIHIFDDSDSSGSGELDFSSAVYDASVSAGPLLAEPRFSFNHDVASGGDVDAPFGGPLEIGRAPDRIGIYVFGVDNDASFWNAPFVGLGLVGMRPPDRMPEEIRARTTQGFDSSEALRIFTLPRTLGRSAFPISIESVHGALHYEVRGSGLVHVVDRLGPRPAPPWKRLVRTRMHLAGGGRPAGLVGLAQGVLALALSDEGQLSRRAGLEGAWEELEGPALAALNAHPLPEGGLALAGLDTAGRLQVAWLAEPLGEPPRWQELDLRAAGLPVAVTDRRHLHLLPVDAEGGLWHATLGTAIERMRPQRLAERIAGRPAAALGRDGRLRVAFAERDGAAFQLLALDEGGEVGERRHLEGRPATPLAIVDDEAEGVLLAALDGEDRVVVGRPGDGTAEWEVLGPLDEVLEGPINPVATELPAG